MKDITKAAIQAAPFLVSPVMGVSEAIKEIAKRGDDFRVVIPNLRQHRLEEIAAAAQERLVVLDGEAAHVISTAAGLSYEGMKVILVAPAWFIMAGQAAIREGISFGNAPLTLVGLDAGLGGEPSSWRTHCLEDIAMMRTLPRLAVIAPADARQTQAALVSSVDLAAAVYIRIPSVPVPLFFMESLQFNVGKMAILREGYDAAIIASGPCIYRALTAAEEMAENGLSARVVDSSTIAPLDEELIMDTVQRCKAIVVCEEHQPAGGLGEAVAAVCGSQRPTAMALLNTRKLYGTAGKYDELIDFMNLNKTAIIKAVRRVRTRR